MKFNRLTLAATTVGLGLTSAFFTANAERKAAIDNPPEGLFVELDGVKLHYTDDGTGDAVVLLHGNGVSHADFRACGLIDRLAKTHRVINFDRPGYGHSTRPATKKWTPRAQAALLLAAMEQIGVERAVVVGHSMGTVIALAMALREPHRVASLVLISGYYYPTRRLDIALEAPLSWPYIGTALLYTVTSMTARLLLDFGVKGMFAPNSVPPTFLPNTRRELMVRPSQIRASAEDASYLRVAALEMEGQYVSLSMPVTVIAGAADPVVHAEDHSVRLHGEVGHSALILKRGIGHMVHYFALQEVVESVTGGDPSAGLVQVFEKPVAENWRSLERT